MASIKLKGFFAERPKALPVRPLYHANGSPVCVGDIVTSGKGQTAKVTGWPYTGHNRVWVEWTNGEMGTEYFPNVFNLTWND